MKTRKITVVDLDDFDQIQVNVGDINVEISAGGNRTHTGTIAYIVVTRPTSDGRCLRTIIKDIVGDGQTTSYEEVADIRIEPCVRQLNRPRTTDWPINF